MRYTTDSFTFYILLLPLCVHLKSKYIELMELEAFISISGVFWLIYVFWIE